MARLARLYIPGCPQVLALQAAGGRSVFATRESFAAFKQQLPLSAREEGVTLHAYCLIPQGAMLMLTAPHAEATGRVVQNINRHISSVLRAHNPQGQGQLWEARFKSTVVQPGLHSLKACLYVDTWAERVLYSPNLAAYTWSSFAAHAGVVNEPWLADLPAYWALGNTPFDRQSRYRQLAEHGLGQREQVDLEQAIHKGWLWSDEPFALQAQALANRPIRPRAKGRPPKKPVD